MRHPRAATYHTRHQKKSQLKQQAQDKTTCKSSQSSSEEVVRAFSPGPKRYRNAPSAPGESPAPQPGVPASPKLSPGGPRPSRLAPRATSRLPDLQSWDAGGGVYISILHLRGGWLSQPPACLEPGTECETISQKEQKKNLRQGPHEDLAQT